ncbi:hypothetical protein GYMLUDRAFT_39935 [Collybiopsis luxurians FD-317 M1]|nr:hypothetical protein GYMLUDRAFT_39935 [Collybiopsis luxurians FD-317 M1]
MRFFIAIAALLFSSAIAAPIVLSTDTKPRSVRGLDGPRLFDKIADRREEALEVRGSCTDISSCTHGGNQPSHGPRPEGFHH